MNEKNIKKNIIENNYNEILKEIFDTKNIHEIFQIIKNKKQTNIDKFHEIIYSKDFNDKVILNKLFNCLKIKLDKPNKEKQILQNTIYDYLITPNDEIFFNLDLKEIQDINIKQLYADIIKGKYKNLKNNGINKIKDIGLNLNNLMEIPIKQYKNIILCFKYLVKKIIL